MFFSGSAVSINERRMSGGTSPSNELATMTRVSIVTSKMYGRA